MPKMEFPCFDGENPRRSVSVWDVFQCLFNQRESQDQICCPQLYRASDDIAADLMNAAAEFSIGNLRSILDCCVWALSSWSVLYSVASIGCPHRQDRSEYLPIWTNLNSYLMGFSIVQHDQWWHLFVTRFLGGLKEEIRSAILLHRSKDVQIVGSLALTQE